MGPAFEDLSRFFREVGTMGPALDDLSRFFSDETTVALEALGSFLAEETLAAAGLAALILLLEARTICR